jgi:outer membrane protein OmpA-like peptidoglycan-associated protein
LSPTTAASTSRDRPKDQEDDVISAFLPKSLPRRAAVGSAVFAALFVAACTCTTGNAFRITKPTDGQHLPPGDVVVCVTAVPGDYCYFPPKAYEITLDGGQSRMIAAGTDPLCSTFNRVGAGPHVADAWVIRNGKRAETSRVKFVVDPPPPPPTPVPTPVPTPMPAPPRPPPAAVEEMVAITQKGGYLEDIFFDFDKFVIKPEYHERLARGAEWIKNHPDTNVTIEGHCDIRGTNKYNLVLGKKRSKATFDYMVKLGVDPARITATTVGEEQPFDTAKNETAYASNRRSHFIITKR